ncbi:MAG: hypothetical protein HOP16_06410 [Acidobacteria bacterium]|nr:hypothetical protein [Acidobacteriota bacterium]
MAHHARRFSSLLSACAALTVALALSVTISAQDATRGAALLAVAQQAVGGAKPLAAVKTLQVTGKFRRVVAGNDTDGDFEVFIELPDKYLRSEKTGTPGQPSSETIEALIGTEVRDVTRGGRAGGAGRGNAPGGDAPGDPNDDAGAVQPEVQRDAPSGETAAEADAQAAPAAGRGRGGVPNADALLRARQAEVSRFLLMWLLRSEAPLAWVGTAQSPDGSADVLEVRYTDALPTRLFLETKTHQPLMLQWTAIPGQAAGAGGRRGGGGRRGAPPEGAPAARQGGPPQQVALDMTFSDYRAVNGIRFPHVITRGANGQTTERWTITRYRVNPSFDAETFAR